VSELLSLGFTYSERHELTVRESNVIMGFSSGSYEYFCDLVNNSVSSDCKEVNIAGGAK